LARGSWPALLLFALTLLLFARSCGNDFVNYDDPDYVTANPQVRAGLSFEGVRWAFTSGAASNWHPLTWLSHQLDVTLFGLNPRGHHATSVFLHALNAALAFFAFRRLTGAAAASLVCAALFAWHPLRVESVSWIAERKDVLSGCLWFFTLWCYAVYTERRRPGGAGAGRWYVATLVAFALGLMAKPMLVTLPCVLLLLDGWPLRRAGAVRDWLPLVREKLPFFVLVAASAYVTYRVQQAGGSVSAVLGLGDRCANALVAIARYLGKVLFPVELAVLYPHPGTWPVPRVLAAAALVAALSALALWQVRRRPAIAVGWAWFLGALVPVIGLVQVGVQSMADRYTYLTVPGLQLAVLWTLRELLPRRMAAVLAGITLAAAAVLTWRQQGVWRDSDTLFSHALAVTERNYVAHDNRGLHRHGQGRIDEALADYRASLAIHPGYLNAHNNLGHALARLGRPAEALPHYRAALTAQPGHPEVRNNLANALSDLGQLDEAMEHYAFVLARDPDHVNALNGSAVVLALRGQPGEARARLERSLRLDSANAGAHHNLGNVLSMLGDKAGAARHYDRARALTPPAGR
jgi:tetratricopeptide (TPR) repeat protein